jgi:small subunit ribosomal protein S6
LLDSHRLYQGAFLLPDVAIERADVHLDTFIHRKVTQLTMPKAKTATEPAKVEVPEEDLRKYELMVLIDPDNSSVEYQKHLDEVKKLIESHAGKIWHEEDWGKRELAYTIKKKDYGYYAIFNFNAPGEAIQEIGAQLRITSYVLRHLLVKVPDNYEPQQYELDEVEEEAKPEPKARPVRKAAPKKAAPAAKKAEPKKEEKAEKEADSSEKKAKLDKKLDELLSGDDDDLNL